DTPPSPYFETDRRPAFQPTTKVQRIECATLRKYTSMSWPQIAEVVGVTERQAQYACTLESFSPQFAHRGRRGLIRTPLRCQISAFIKATDENRVIPWHDLPLYLS